MKKISKKRFLKGMSMLAIVGVVLGMFKWTGFRAKQAESSKYPQLAKKEPRAVSRNGFRA